VSSPYPAQIEEHLIGQHYGWLKGLRVTADGTGIVSHAGAALLRGG